MSKTPELFTCKKCGEAKLLEGFYTNSKVDKNKPYQLVCRKCYQLLRKTRESGKPRSVQKIRDKRRSIKIQTPSPFQIKPTQLICSIRQFHEFIGPKVRNDIQTLTKREKLRLRNICQDCGEQKELHAAHIKGKDRKQIISSVLTNYLIDEKEQIIQVDLSKVIGEIVEAHKPLNEHFRFLCSECHGKYDS